MNKLDSLCNWFSDKKSVIVAVSGGVDSALVAYAAYAQLGNSAIAVTADYKTLSNDELDSSKKICKEIGINQIIINYSELENEDFVRNDKNRCFYCRTELSHYLINIAKENQIETIVDGTNLDDLGDYRPGLVALQENNILHPLVECNFTKNEVRDISKDIGLSIHNRPSNSCLASRVPWGQRVTAEKLTRIEMGETFVKQIVGAKQVRVRDLDGSAKIEVGVDELYLLNDPSKINEINMKLKFLGFSSVQIDPDGYSPGKLNVIVD
ncbi:MAG: ATP-dependent sacrificial sulfur transferase LarE [Crenarchaeota archaeon]|nr:MAG: ATP-dependent sacrificial sulfur transferase LarE [Thermoproteota archaeon]RDJ33568.1 MAG: ATP-dependent sacrificial sulfur transferase LarE [Thermoproteota archaeon]RDJ38110.1 MAG: ATP-dependent sacrificial sulfur transferase LarE [Thermoproteota archaeon]RDJ39121.1 MAG: ATP-dependent sacrificial sulfur transferase LarE [Thermoproteota archaeon]